MIIQPSKGAAELAAEDTKALNRKMRRIRSEIQTVGEVRHRNLVPLLAHVSRPNCHYLVYEYMENKRLQDFLRKAQAGERQLEWLARHKIAIGVVSGLEYLHMSHTPRNNVLLDAHMEARITDFGLAPEANTYMTISVVAGSLGYIAPECFKTKKFNGKCDIYSFGVLLGVLVMGKFPSDAFFENTATDGLVKWLRDVMNSDNPRQAIDPLLLDNGYAKQK
ncbi:leucine-rich repeat receptor-like serine/threonine/tyrosine-protein kinase SOBIR1 [Tanacetum coccineum]